VGEAFGAAGGECECDARRGIPFCTQGACFGFTLLRLTQNNCRFHFHIRRRSDGEPKLERPQTMGSFFASNFSPLTGLEVLFRPVFIGCNGTYIPETARQILPSKKQGMCRKKSEGCFRVFRTISLWWSDPAQLRPVFSEQ
jgi:hypothetical protein